MEQNVGTWSCNEFFKPSLIRSQILGFARKYRRAHFLNYNIYPLTNTCYTLKPKSTFFQSFSTSKVVNCLSSMSHGVQLKLVKSTHWDPCNYIVVPTFKQLNETGQYFIIILVSFRVTCLVPFVTFYYMKIKHLLTQWVITKLLVFVSRFTTRFIIATSSVCLLLLVLH